MDFYVEPSPRGGWNVMLAGTSVPVSHHDTEAEAADRAASYTRGAGEAEPSPGGRPQGEPRELAERPPIEPLELRDGSRVLVRTVVPSDRHLLAAGFGSLGERSRYRRFMTTKQALTPSELTYFTDIDHHDHEAIGALDSATGAGVGVARYVRQPTDRTRAEAAVAVVDDWQGRGLGAALLKRLTARAEQEGVTHFTASLLMENHEMLHLFQRIGQVKLLRREGSVEEIDVELPVETEPRDALGQVLRLAAAGDLRL